MFNRREFLTRTLQGSSLLALGPMVPGFLANTAQAAEAGKDNVLVVIEMNGGNDGLNTVIPYADDLYHKARPTLHFTKEQVVRVDDHIGLNPAMRGLDPLLKRGDLAIVQGVGYPNPDRSHFESMDIWQSADLKQFVQRRQLQTYTTLDRLQEVLAKPDGQQEWRQAYNTFGQKLGLISKLIRQDLGTRVFYISHDGFDTHSGQATQHEKLLGE